MKFIWQSEQKFNLKVLMNRLGYHQSLHSANGESSFIKRLTSQQYPRLHIYPEITDRGLLFKLHLDEKNVSYQGVSRHSGQYSGEVLDREKIRIIEYLNNQQ